MSRRLAARVAVALVGPILAALIIGITVLAGGSHAHAPASSPVRRVGDTPSAQAGAPLSGPAPNFTLVDQFGRRVSLSSFRGKVVLMAFTDPYCTTICPITTTAMVQAQRLLGSAGSRVALLGVDANPTATSVKAVRAYSAAHGLTHRWQFVTGSLAQLKAVWHAYHIEARLVAGLVDHTPALYVIGPTGRQARLYLTTMSYSSVGWLAQQLARESSSLLPGHPPVRPLPSQAAPGSIIPPTVRATLPRAGGGTVQLGPGSPRVVLFFATWESEMANLPAELETLNRYQTAARRQHLPGLVAIDDGTVEPSATALPRLLHSLPRPLAYPVAIDRTGRVADGYGVEDEPWLEIIPASGRNVTYYDVGVNGWPRIGALIAHVRAALAARTAG